MTLCGCRQAATEPTAQEPTEAEAGAVQPVRLTPQAQKNLALVSQPIKAVDFWRKIEIPGVVADRPGVSDRGVVAPVAGVVIRIYHYPGDTVQPDAPLFGIRLISESLHASQLELFKATREIEIAEQQKSRLADAASSGALAQSRIVEIENQVRRLQVTVEAYQQDLRARGLTKDRIEAASRGQFVTELIVRAPKVEPLPDSEKKAEPEAKPDAEVKPPATPPFAFEIHDLNVELGEQVSAGKVLCHLADHRALLIEGRGFKEDMPYVQEAAKNGWPIEVEFESPAIGNWPPLPTEFFIHHVANTIDLESRTFQFDLLLENQWQQYTQQGETRMIWRLRPGDRVRLHVAVEKFAKVFVLPREALVRDGPHAIVFRQNGEFFDPRPVHVLYEDRRHVVIANDGSIRAGFYFAQNAAASIRRVMKAQAASGQSNVHVHPDGTVHAAH